MIYVHCTYIISNIVVLVDLDMWLKVLYFCLIISSLTLGQDNPCARALGEKDPCARSPFSEKFSRRSVSGMDCDTCKVFGEIERIINQRSDRLQNRFESEMMKLQLQIAKTELANMKNDYHYKPETTYYDD